MINDVKDFKRVKDGCQEISASVIVDQHFTKPYCPLAMRRLKCPIVDIFFKDFATGSEMTIVGENFIPTFGYSNDGSVFPLAKKITTFEDFIANYAESEMH